MRAVISLGTNTTRLLVVRADAGRRLHIVAHEQTGTRLGERLNDTGLLLPEAIERTLAAVRRFVDLARASDAELFAIATSAVRRATNAAAFAGRMEALTGVPLRVLPGELEAEASFRGATYGARASGRVAVLDVGGGSTECAVGVDGVLEAARSIEIGSVRVAERYPALMGGSPGDAARRAAREARHEIAGLLAPLRTFRPVTEVRCVAGTPLTIAAVLYGSGVEQVSGLRLRREALDATLERLLSLTLAERRALPGMLPQRADILPAGALIVSEALAHLGADEALLEANDLLLGFLSMLPDAAAAE